MRLETANEGGSRRRAVRSKRIGIVVMLLLVGIAVFLLWPTSGPPEPVFEGRPLSSWLDRHVASSSAIPPYGSPGWKKADEAIRSIGTNGIPILLEMIRAKDSPAFVLRLKDAARRLGFSPSRWKPHCGASLPRKLASRWWWKTPRR